MLQLVLSFYYNDMVFAEDVASMPASVCLFEKPKGRRDKRLLSIAYAGSFEELDAMVTDLGAQRPLIGLIECVVWRNRSSQSLSNLVFSGLDGGLLPQATFLNPEFASDRLYREAVSWLLIRLLRRVVLCPKPLDAMLEDLGVSSVSALKSFLPPFAPLHPPIKILLS